MKQINLLLVSFLLVVSGFFTSCTKDEEGSGSLDFISDGGTYIDENTTVEPGAALKFKFTATSESDMEFMEIVIETSSSIQQRKWSLDIPNEKKNNLDGTATITAPTELGTYTYIFNIWNANPDDDDEAVLLVTRSLVITVAADFNTFTSKLLYDASGTTTKTFFSSITGTTYTVTEAVDAANKSKIDFGFLYDQEFATTKACLISFDEYSKSANYATQLTGTLNATIFKTVASSSIYDNAADATALQSAYNGGTAIAAFGNYGAGKIAKVLNNGDIIAFKTNSNKYGLIKIVTIDRKTESTNNTQTMDISVKVQK